MYSIRKREGERERERERYIVLCSRSCAPWREAREEAFAPAEEPGPLQTATGN